MATPKFPLTMGDGTKARTLEELRAHADLYTLEQRVLDQRLVRWLADRGYEEQKAQVERLQAGSGEFHRKLCEALSIGWSEALWKDYQAKINEAEVEKRNEEQRRAEKKAKEEQQKAEERAKEEQRQAEERAREEQRKAEEQAKEEQRKADERAKEEQQEAKKRRDVIGTRMIDGNIIRANTSSLNLIFPCLFGIYDRLHDVFRVRLLQLGKYALEPAVTPYYKEDIDMYMSNKCYGTHYPVPRMALNSDGTPFGITADEMIIAKDMLGLHMSSEDVGVLKHMVRIMRDHMRAQNMI